MSYLLCPECHYPVAVCEGYESQAWGELRSHVGHDHPDVGRTDGYLDRVVQVEELDRVREWATCPLCRRKVVLGDGGSRVSGHYRLGDSRFQALSAWDVPQCEASDLEWREVLAVAEDRKRLHVPGQYRRPHP